jgi:hypothetical protein
MQRSVEMDKLNRLEIEIRKKEQLAADAKDKGMHATYGNYMEDLVQLNVKLKKLQTDPFRKA